MRLSRWFLGGSIILALGVLGISACKKGSTPHEGHEKSAAPSASLKGHYHCPMHPAYTSDKPGDCPICGMSLVLIESDQAHEEAVRLTRPAGEQAGVASSSVTGQAPVTVAASRQQLIGVRLDLVAKRELQWIIRSSGRVAYDPELYSAIAEHREAISAQRKIKDSPWPDVHERSEALVRASTLRLRQMGLSEAQINEIPKKLEQPTNLLLGQAGGTVWIYAQIYEYESGLVRPGQKVEVTAAAFPGQTFQGKVKAVDPILNAETRSLRVRAEVPNPEGLLKPEMYVDAAIHVDLGRRLAVPAEAVIDTGTRQIVFVEKGPGLFEPRELRLGQKAGGFRAVVSGVQEGEKVVVSGNFLIDSESKLKAATSQPGGHQH